MNYNLQQLKQFYLHKKYILTRTGNIGRSRTAATPKMELLVAIVTNEFQPLTITTKSFILGNAAVLDPRLEMFSEKCVSFLEMNGATIARCSNHSGDIWKYLKTRDKENLLH